MHQMILRLPEDKAAELKRNAKARGITLTGLIRMILSEWLERR